MQNYVSDQAAFEVKCFRTVDEAKLSSPRFDGHSMEAGTEVADELGANIKLFTVVGRDEEFGTLVTCSITGAFSQALNGLYRKAFAGYDRAFSAGWQGGRSAQ
eukprot:2561424-Amphidinium_carterae.1